MSTFIETRRKRDKKGERGREKCFKIKLTNENKKRKKELKRRVTREKGGKNYLRSIWNFCFLKDKRI